MRTVVDDIKEQAERELEVEARRLAVDRYKDKLRKLKWYHKLFPFKVELIIKRRDGL